VVQKNIRLIHEHLNTRINPNERSKATSAKHKNVEVQRDKIGSAVIEDYCLSGRDNK
jgi:hypothetical protein